MSPTGERVFFVVPGRPVPACRMTQRSKFYERAKRALEYQELVALCARAAHAPVFSGPVRLTCRFWFKTCHHGDLSNLVKAVEDGLQFAGVLRNDRQVIRYGAGTGIYYGPEERAEVIVEEVRDEVGAIFLQRQGNRVGRARAGTVGPRGP